MIEHFWEGEGVVRLHLGVVNRKTLAQSDRQLQASPGFGSIRYVIDDFRGYWNWADIDSFPALAASAVASVRLPACLLPLRGRRAAGAARPAGPWVSQFRPARLSRQALRGAGGSEGLGARPGNCRHGMDAAAAATMPPESAGNGARWREFLHLAGGGPGAGTQSRARPEPPARGSRIS